MLPQLEAVGEEWVARKSSRRWRCCGAERFSPCQENLQVVVERTMLPAGGACKSRERLSDGPEPKTSINLNKKYGRSLVPPPNLGYADRLDLRRDQTARGTSSKTAPGESADERAGSGGVQTSKFFCKNWFRHEGNQKKGGSGVATPLYPKFYRNSNRERNGNARYYRFCECEWR